MKVVTYTDMCLINKFLFTNIYSLLFKSVHACNNISESIININMNKILILDGSSRNLATNFPINSGNFTELIFKI